MTGYSPDTRPDGPRMSLRIAAQRPEAASRDIHIYAQVMQNSEFKMQNGRSAARKLRIYKEYKTLRTYV